MFRGQTGITETVVFDLHSVKCSLGKFSFRNSQCNPCLNPKLKFSFSRTVFTLKFKILIIYRDLLAYNWACQFCAESLLAAAEGVCCGFPTSMSWPLLQVMERASPSWSVWSGALGRGGRVPVTLSLCLCKATVLSSPRKEPWAKGANRASETYPSFRIHWNSM